MALVYKNEYLTTLQERLADESLVEKVCRMEFTNTRVIHNPYMTASTASAYLRGSGYTPAAVATTDDTITISSALLVPQYIDRADMAQKSFSDWMIMAEDQALSLQEGLESAMLALYSNWTTFDNASIGGSAGNITVSESNIEDIITGVKREIREAKAGKLANRNGIFIIWRPADFELLEKYAAAQGFSVADRILINGADKGVKLFGVEHYYSNLISAGHLFAGVKNVYSCGICKDTYGQIVETEDPYLAAQSGQMSALGIISRLDYGFEAWYNIVGVLFNITVA
jgi:hypothetical protein